MELLYDPIAPLWVLDTTILERRLEWCQNISDDKRPTYEWSGKRFQKNRRKLDNFIAIVTLELAHRRDVTYRQLVSTMIAGKGDNTIILVMADRLEELGDDKKANEYRQWVDTKQGTKVYTNE